MTQRTAKEAQRRQKARNRYLLPPEEHRADLSGPELARWLRRAQRALQDSKNRKYHPALLTRLHRREAAASSAIEDVTNSYAIDLHTAALTRIISRKPSIKSMLEAHRTIMRGHDHAQPGMLRTVNVQVGHHLPPNHRRVPQLVKQLYAYVQDPDENQLAKAVYAHLQFEIIHPFADGNGRTGRALINQILQSPAPVSEWILNNRQDYYRLLDQGEWRPFALWMLQGLTETLKAMTKA